MRKYLIFGLVLIIIMGSLLLPKIMGEKEDLVKFKALDIEDVPEKIVEMLPQYIMEERALTCKYRDDIYVIVTRGEKKSVGYFVDIEKIVREEYSKDSFDIVVYAKYIDPNPNEVLPQEYDYPAIIVKTNLKAMPDQIHLDIEYLE
ncbi:MAG: protease complex subunit PrcB family protein [Tissierellaceae bacterium]|nr:protease complex subunit PrcB family protein [Tissierellaceae bacterium]